MKIINKVDQWLNLKLDDSKLELDEKTKELDKEKTNEEKTPKGDENDSTRKPSFYNGTYNI